MACYVYILSPAVLSAVPPLLFLLLIITTTSNNNNNNNNNNSNNNNDKQINTNKYKTSEAFLSRGLETGQESFAGLVFICIYLFVIDLVVVLIF